jgi:ubiquinone biosynthesis protein
VVRGELDLRLEAAAASEFADNTERDEGFRVPAVRWATSGKRVMTLDWVEGIGAADVPALDAAGHDRPALAARVLQLFLRHALRDGYFHGDMHQGNLKVDRRGDLVAYDFGIMGRIDDYTRRVYAEILWGFIRRDYRRVAEVHFEAGYVPPDRDVAEFAQALRAVGEPIFGMDASRISMGRLLAYLFEVTERFGMQTRTELILLQRTMVVVEGVARSLDPRMNIWDGARPVVEGYIRDALGPAAVARDLARTARTLARLSPHLPELLREASVKARTAGGVPIRVRLRWGPAALWVALGAALALAGAFGLGSL